MFERFFPDEYLDSTYSIDFDQLYKEGYRGIIFDIDNTLVPHGAPADERAISLFAHLKELGFHCMLLSNNREPRVKMFNDAVHVNYIYKAGKPKPSGYRKAMGILGTDTTNTLFVGDQIFTDVCGANLAGIRTILVKKGNCPVNQLHRKASSLVKAGTQSSMMEVIEPMLTEEEHSVYRRGRNAHSPTMAKHATMADYRRATGFEALMGYLYLKDDFSRIIELVRAGIGEDKI